MPGSEPRPGAGNRASETPGPRILLTGATGYIGGRLLGALEEAETAVRCMARDPERLRPRLGPDSTAVAGDVLEPATLPRALEGVDTAYYLIHSMGSGDDFEARDREGARNFARAARGAGVGKIVYLGGLGHGDDLSAHLRSRQEVGRILRESGVPTVELRASIILGSGSLSFEMIRALVERLPVMVHPRWVRTPSQPIAVEDVVAYLVEALAMDPAESVVYEIGGARRVSYAEIMRAYARVRGLRRLMIPVPVLTPRLSSLWLGLVTPVYARVGRKLIEGLRNPTVVRDPSALEAFDLRPLGVTEAIRRALRNEDREFAETRWSDALSSSLDDGGWGGRTMGSRRVDARSARVDAPPEDAFRPVRRIGGDVGWYYADWLWRLRGFLDLLVRGPGMRRGRRDPEAPLPGDTLDFWRVEDYEAPRLLRLRAEMRLPGRAWLQFEVEPLAEGRSRIVQTALFDPAGLAGLLYWYGLWPLHALIFRGMLRRIAQAGEAAARGRHGTDDDRSRRGLIPGRAPGAPPPGARRG